MRCYRVIAKGDEYRGGWAVCLFWAMNKLVTSDDVASVLVARGGERYWRLIAEVTLDGVRMLPGSQVYTR